jgi:dolichol-phosphate mannosyltransferase
MCSGRISGVLSSAGEDYEIIFVNDGSSDETLPIIRALAGQDKRLKVISLSRNFGQQAAFSAGMEYAKGDAVIFMDADLQDPPEVIPEFIAKWREGYRIIYGVRKRREGESKFKRFSATLYYRLLSGLADIKIPHDTGDFRLIDRCVLDTVRKMPEHNRFLRGMSCWTGFKQISVEYRREKRFSGETK